MDATKDPDFDQNSRYLENPAKFLHETGLLWKINKEILHPLGIAIYYGENEEGHAEGGIGVQVSTDAEPFDFDPVRETRAKDRLTTFLLDPQKFIKSAR